MDETLFQSREFNFLFDELLDAGSLLERSGGSADHKAVGANPLHDAQEAGIEPAMQAVVKAYRDFLECLGRMREGKPGRQPIRDPEVRRMLLAQKAHAEGCLALCFYFLSLFEKSRADEGDDQSQRAHVLLELLTPVVDFCPRGIGPGSELNWRETPLWPPDKLPIGRPCSYGIFKQEVRITMQVASMHPGTMCQVQPLEHALSLLDHLISTAVPQMARGNAKGLACVPLYLGIAGRIALAWIWVRQAVLAARALDQGGPQLARSEIAFYRGKLQAARYYVEWELPRIDLLSGLLRTRNATSYNMKDSWFGPKC